MLSKDALENSEVKKCGFDLSNDLKCSNEIIDKFGQIKTTGGTVINTTSKVYLFESELMRYRQNISI